MIYKPELTEKIIGAAVEVHKVLGPGLLESIYEECLCYELHRLNLSFERQKQIPITYKGIHFDFGYKMDLVVCNKVVVELKCVDLILPIHEAQLLTYLKLSQIQIGLLVNFKSRFLKQGLKRMINTLDSVSP
jgi:GxxExxY protein